MSRNGRRAIRGSTVGPEHHRLHGVPLYSSLSPHHIETQAYRIWNLYDLTVRHKRDSDPMIFPRAEGMTYYYPDLVGMV